MNLNQYVFPKIPPQSLNAFKAEPTGILQLFNNSSEIHRFPVFIFERSCCRFDVKNTSSFSIYLAFRKYINSSVTKVYIAILFPLFNSECFDCRIFCVVVIGGKC